ncbi:MAG: ribosome small subunit-dependent GTPase A [Pseudomonadota bacterium]|nr:ribosome small subunit-dependent GTPase A [Pseudomonadota bacterium]
MTRDYSKFSLGGAPAPRPALSPLQSLGWQPFFSSQIDADDMATYPPVRVTAVHRSGLSVRGDGIEAVLPPDAEVTVGDWLLYDAERPGASRLLDRKSLIQRRAAGHEVRSQLIAANIETVFIVTSCNADFNVARLERYLALAFEAGIDPVILLTKADMAEDVSAFVAQAAAISDRAPALALDARGEEPRDKLAAWTKPGRTVAFLGSSGVGKSTLTNALAGGDMILTQGIREDDAKGRHTTTHRELHVMPGGPVVLDTPGMREIQLSDVAEGIAAVFADIEALATECKFRDCAHETEPGCAIKAAIEAGDLDPDRLERWRKLAAEDMHNSESIAERRAREKGFSKMVKRVGGEKPNRR